MNTHQHEPVDPRVLGQRIVEARKARGLTQEDVAKFLGCSRPTYIAIEKGDRPIRSEELVRLSEYLGRTVNELVRPGRAVSEFKPHLRAAASKGGDDKTKAELAAAIEAFQRLASDYLRLEQLAEAPHRRNYPPEIRIGQHVNAVNLAEAAATQERQRLGLGDQPVIRLRQLLEWEVGARIFHWPMPSAVSGMYAFNVDLGICIMVNSRHPLVRRRWSVLHEYGHAIVDRFSPGIDYLGAGGRKAPNERFADAFAMAFLMPASAVRQHFYEVLNSKGDFQVADLVRLSHYFVVSLEATALRLENLDLLRKGTWQWLSEDRVSRKKMAEELGLERPEEPNHRLPERYVSLAVLVYDRGLVTERDLAGFLRCTPIEARQLAEEQRLAADGKSSDLRLGFHESLIRR